MRTTQIAVLLALAPGCSQIFGLDSPDRLRADAAIDAAIGCTNDFPCPASAPHCAVAQGYCVQCQTSPDCTDPSKPLCDPDTLTCEGCLSHTDCASGVCLPSGTCGSDADVLFVTPSGTNNPSCSQAMPCQTIDYATTRVTATRKVLKLSGAFSIMDHIDYMLVDSIWLADPGTTFTAQGQPMIDVRSGARLEIHGLTVDCNNSADRGFRVESNGVLHIDRTTIQNCRKLAIDMAGGALVIERSLIMNNDGGVETNSGPFSITNTFFVRNGINGAVRIESSNGQNRFEMNTVVDNMANTGSTAARTGGVSCPGTSSLIVSNNIIARNTGYYANVSGGCDFAGSFITDVVAPLAFLSPDVAPFDYHIGTNSTARDSASASTLTSDFDGDARPQNAEFDFGADEYKGP